MKKSFGQILIVSLLAVLLSGCSMFVAQTNDTTTPPATSPPVITPSPLAPRPPEWLPPEERFTTYYLVDQQQLAGTGLPLPCSLTDQEKENIIEISLNSQPVQEMISKYYSYRTEPIWMSYQPSAMTWANYSLDKMATVTQINPEITYFPAARIGIGTPQQFEMHVAVDLSTK